MTPAPNALADEISEHLAVAGAGEAGISDETVFDGWPLGAWRVIIAALCQQSPPVPASAERDAGGGEIAGLVELKTTAEQRARWLDGAPPGHFVRKAVADVESLLTEKTALEARIGELENAVPSELELSNLFADHIKTKLLLTPSGQIYGASTQGFGSAARAIRSLLHPRTENKPCP